MIKQFLFSFVALTFFLTGCSESFEPKTISDCNRFYYQTSYETTWTSTEDARLDFNRWSGKITFEPQSKKEHQAEVAWGMDTDKFFELCSEGNRGVWSTACSHFQNCVSVVKNLEIPNREQFVSLDYRGTAEFIKQKLYSKGKTEPRETCFWDDGSCSMTVDNINEACDVVSQTYSAITVGDSIFRNIPELDYHQSQELGKKAVRGYGECQCALHNALGIKDDMSIGYCVGDEYVNCLYEAFCGRNVSR